MKTAIQVSGFLLILASMALGLYVGIWVCFVGGIVTIVEICNGTLVTYASATFAWAIVKILFFELAGAFAALPGYIIGYFMLHIDD